MFRNKKRIKFPLWALVAAVVGVIVIGFELYSIVVPFQASNPLWHQVTMGQPVIDSWAYGGQDEEGYLRFYNQGESVVLPPTAKLFSADGQFVVIEGYSPSTLTYASPFEAIPVSVLLLMIAAGGVGGWVLWRRFKSKNQPGMNFRAQSSPMFRLPNKMGQSGSSKGWTAGGNKRFRARPSRRSRFKR